MSGMWPTLLNSKQAVGAVVVLTAVLLWLLWKAPVSAVVFFCMALGFVLMRHEPGKAMGAVLAPVAVAAVMAWSAATAIQGGHEFWAVVSDAEPPGEITWQAVTGAQPATTAAEKGGRVAMVLGGVVGLLLIVSRRRGAWHGPGIVRGRKVEEGGWSTAADLVDKCDFGMLRKGQHLVPLGKLQGRLVSVNPTKGKIKMAGHLLAVGATGTGKSYTLIRNLIIAAAMAEDSVIATDPKGELFEDMARWLESEGYTVYAYNVVNPACAHWWNPLMECRDYDEMQNLAEWLINAAGDDHAFFSGGEKNILAAVMAYARWVLPKGQNHMRAALSVLSWPQETLDGLYTKAFRKKKVPPAAYETWKAAQGHYTNYIEGVRNKIRAITEGSLSALSSESDFDLSVFGRKKTALFLILPEEAEGLQSLYTPFYGFMFRRLKEEAEACGGRLKVGVRFILDELANIGKIPALDKQCSLGRSRGIMIQIAIQNIGQLQGLYRKENVWKAIAGNCPIKACLSVDDIESAQFFARQMGAAKIRDVRESRNVSNSVKAIEPAKKTESLKDVKLMEAYELMQMPEDDCVVLLRNKRPAYLQKMKWVDMPQARQIVAAGKCRTEEYFVPRSLTVDLPPYPDEEEVPEKPERSRGRPKAKSQEIPGEDVGGLDTSAAEELGL